MPVIYILILLTTAYQIAAFNSGYLIGSYIGFRFFYFFQSHFKWYYFFIIIAELFYAVKVVNKQVALFPESAMHSTFERRDKAAFFNVGKYGNNPIIKTKIYKTDINGKFENLSSKEYYFIVTNQYSNNWIIDWDKTINYNRENNNYGFSDSLDYQAFRDVTESNILRKYWLLKSFKFFSNTFEELEFDDKNSKLEDDFYEHNYHEVIEESKKLMAEYPQIPRFYYYYVNAKLKLDSSANVCDEIKILVNANLPSAQDLYKKKCM